MQSNPQILTAMKRLILLFVFTACFVACEQEDPELTLSSNQESVSADGGSVSVSVTSNYAWSAVPGASWITVSPLSGNPGTTTVVLQVAKNTEHANRIASVTFTCADLKRMFSVAQSQPMFQQLAIVHHAATFTVPFINGVGMNAVVDFGEGEKKSYEKGLTWTYSAAGSHRVVIDCAGAFSMSMENIAGVTEIDLSAF